MGYVKEPNDVDFIIQSSPLTEKEKQEISNYIRTDKSKHNKPVTRKKVAKQIAGTSKKPADKAPPKREKRSLL
ncbi:MAG: hypothetical protein LBP68_02650 [Acidobacteriota bacterium]|jgi:hypothetical protein|nr:hypothetical protein [Acidobacteriota bacterium]